MSSDQYSRMALTVHNRNLHFDEIDWPKLKSATIENLYSEETGALGRWPVGSLMSSVENLLNNTLELFVSVGKEITSIEDNKDLNETAKIRKQKEAFSKYIERIEPLLHKAGDNFRVIADRAESGLLAVLPRATDDVTGSLLDQEIRSYLRSLDNTSRNDMITKARKGQHPEFVQAVLRAPAPLSGVSATSAKNLNAAGIAATHSEALALLHELSIVFGSVVRTATSAVGHFSALAPAASAEFRRPVNSWGKEHEGARKLQAWLHELPYVKA